MKALKTWSSHVRNAGLILLSCPKIMAKSFYDDTAEFFSKDDPRIHKVPLDVGRPTHEAVSAVHEIMMSATLWDKPQLQHEQEAGSNEGAGIEGSSASVGATDDNQQNGSKSVSTPQPQPQPEPEPLIPLNELHRSARDGQLADLIKMLTEDQSTDVDVATMVDERAGEDFKTPLHYAAEIVATAASTTADDGGNEDDSKATVHKDPTTAAGCVTVLLVQGGANPSILDGRHRPPYFLAAHEKVRDAFRLARSTIGEDKWDWDDKAKVGPPLTTNDLDKKKEKAAEKKRRQRARQKEKKAREKAEAEEAERQRKEEEANKKAAVDAKRVRDGLKPKVSTATNVCDYCQKVCKGKRRNQMFQRLEYVYCSTDCVQKHKRELMASAALARFG